MDAFEVSEGRRPVTLGILILSLRRIGGPVGRGGDCSTLRLGGSKAGGFRVQIAGFPLLSQRASQDWYCGVR